ncbi:MAG: glycosyltransferase family 4 protein [Bacteroidota bacterium]
MEVLFCSDETVKGAIDQEFGIKVKWDIPILEGYNYTFLHNHARRPSISIGFWGLLNFGIFNYLRKKPKSVIIIHGWGYATHILTLLLARAFGHTVCLRAETPWNQELLKSKAKTKIKHLLLKLIFSRIDYFLFIGKQNRRFYEKLGVIPSKLLFAPYCVNNDFFNSYSSNTNNNLKIDLGISKNSKIVLSSGKYIAKKRPLDLIQAFNSIKTNNDAILIMVGDGELKSEMESLINSYKLNDRVILTGFINQSKIPAYYAIANVFVMCSEIGETWGLSVNEAMNFGVPVVVSDITGCADDLVFDGINGFKFKTGDIAALENSIQNCLNFSELQLKECSKKNSELLSIYDYSTVIQTLQQLI